MVKYLSIKKAISGMIWLFNKFKAFVSLFRRFYGKMPIMDFPTFSTFVDNTSILSKTTFLDNFTLKKIVVIASVNIGLDHFDNVRDYLVFFEHQSPNQNSNSSSSLASGFSVGLMYILSDTPSAQ